MYDAPFTLHELLHATGGRLVGDNAPSAVESVFTDTRETAKNGLFLAFSGETFDAHNYLAQAVTNGATLLCVEEITPCVLQHIPPRATFREDAFISGFVHSATITLFEVE